MSPRSRQAPATFPLTCSQNPSTMAFPAKPKELALSNNQERPASPTPSPVLGRRDAILGAGQGGPVANPKRHKRGAPRTLHGDSLRLNTVTSLAPWAPCRSVGLRVLLWGSVGLHGAPCGSVKLRVIPWGSVCFCGAPFHSVSFCGAPQGSVSFHGVSWGLCVILRCSMGLRGAIGLQVHRGI